MSDKPQDQGGVPLTPEALKELGMKAPERDLTAERDTRVLPLVSKFLRGVGTHEFKFTSDKKVINDAEEDASYNSFYEKFMVEAMQNDVRVTDLPYMFQLAKKSIEMLQARSSTPKDEMRVVPCALEILAQLGEAQHLMLEPDTIPEDSVKRAELYDEFYYHIVVPAFMKHEVEYKEVDQVFATMISIVSILEHKTGMTIDGAKELAMAKLWGIEDSGDVTLRMLHEKCVEKPVDGDNSSSE